MYFFVILLVIVYWIVYGNWIGGCLVASSFLILIYSINRCKKEEKRLQMKIQPKKWIITQGENMEFVPEILGINSWSNDYIFEIEYEIHTKLHNTKECKKTEIVWKHGRKSDSFLTEKMKECDSYILCLKSVTWRDLTGVYKGKKELNDRLKFLVMPTYYELGEMRDRIQNIDYDEQGFEYDGVRKYQEGDRLSRIHWNLYASKKQLFVRKNEEETQERVKLGLDFSTVPKKRISEYLSVFYSISLFYIQEGIEQEIYYGNHMFLLKNIEQYEDLFADIFEMGMEKPSYEISGIQKIILDEEQKDIQQYLYDMEL